jgi:hypothetical protein
MKDTLLAIALGFAVIGVASCGDGSGGGGQGPKPMAQKDVALTLKDVGGVCSKPDPVEAVKGDKGDAVSWKISNTCAEGTFVTLRDFKPHIPGNPDVYPLEKYDAVWIDAGKTVTLHGKLRKATMDTYSFYFYLDERKQSGDPDIIIDN